MEIVLGVLVLILAFKVFKKIGAILFTFLLLGGIIMIAEGLGISSWIQSLF